MKFKKSILLFCFLLACCVASFGQNTQSDAISIGERKPDRFFKIDFTKPLRLDSFFWDIFKSTDTRAGIVFAKNEDIDEEKHILQPQSLILKDLLDSFVKVKSEYSWKEENGVINVLSKNDYSILETRISEFNVEKALPSKLRETFLQTSEFQAYLKERNLVDKVGDGGFGTIGIVGKISERHKVTIALKNATVREILNEIVRQRGYSTCWSYREYDLVFEGKAYKMYRLEL